MSQYAALRGPKRRVLRVLHIPLAQARSENYHGPRFRLELECGHTVARALVRSCSRVKCGECIGPGYNAKGFLRAPEDQK